MDGDGWRWKIIELELELTTHILQLNEECKERLRNWRSIGPKMWDEGQQRRSMKTQKDETYANLCKPKFWEGRTNFRLEPL